VSGLRRALLFLLSAFSLAAQVNTGRIMGLVTGAGNTKLPGARVSAVHRSTGIAVDTVTNAAGFYVLPGLQPGGWDLGIRAPGLAQAQQQLHIAGGQTVRLDVILAGDHPRITIQPSNAPDLNLQTQSVESILDPAQLVALPSLTLDPYDFVELAPNLSPTDPSGLGAGFAVNGLRASGTNFLLDGANNNDEFTPTSGLRLPLESVKQLSILTSGFTAEYGRAGSAVISVISRSGGNELHGSAYEFNRVSALDSNSFLNNANRIAKGVYNRNQFGYSVGGAIIKNRLFFFQNTEFLRIRGGQTQLALVPAPEFLNSSSAATRQFFTQYGSLRPGIRVLNTFSKAQLNPCTRGVTATDPCFALPVATPMFSEVAWRSPADLGGGAPQDTYAVVANVDYVWDARTRLSARYALWSESDSAGSISSSPYLGYDTGARFFDNRFTVSGHRQWSPSLSGSVRATFSRLSNLEPLGANPPGPTLYMSALAPVSLAGQPVLLPGYNPQTPGGVLPSGGPQNIASIAADGSSLFGRHDLRFGGEFTYIQDNRAFGAFQNAIEGLGTTVGSAIDGLLTGQLHEFDTAINPQGKFPGQTITLPAGPPSFARSDRYRDSALYVQDTWRFTRRLMLNLGLRWEYYGIQHNSNPALDSNFYPGSGSTLQQQIAAGAVSTVPASSLGKLWKPEWRDFAPRVGVAYDLFGDGRTVVRGGYGIAYQRPFGNLTYNIVQNPPNYAVLSLIAGTDLSVIPIQTNNSGPLASSGARTLPPSTLRAIDPDLRTAYAHIFSASIDRALGSSTAASLSYSGSRGERLYSVSNVNPAGSANAYLGAPCTPGSFGFPGTCTARLNPQYSDINLRANGGTSSYNAGIARIVTRNFWRTGVTLDANYTFSHAIDNLSSAFSYPPHGNFVLGFLNPFAPALDRGNSDFDVRHRVAVSAIWEIPWFKNGSLRRILGGWEISPVFTARTGSPFSLYDCANAYNFCERAESSGPLPRKGVTNVPAAGLADSFLYYAFPGAITSQAGIWYNPKVGVSDFGPFPANMLRRNTIYARGTWNVNAGLYKTTSITERIALQLRLELYNAFNHASFYVNTTDADVSSFAGVDGYFDGNRNLQVAARVTF